MHVVSSAAALVLMACFLVSNCGTQGTRDPFLRSLDVDTSPIVATDSVTINDDISAIPIGIVCIDDDWVVLEILQHEYHLLFLDAKTGEHFFAVRKGRGPGEMAQGGSLHRVGGDGRFYDSHTNTCVSFSLADAVLRKSLTLDTLLVFNGRRRPTNLVSCGDGYVSGGHFDPDTWYCFFDSTGAVTSSVPAIWFEDVGSDRDAILSFLLSSTYNSSPDGSKVCAATIESASLSFSTNTGGRLEEYYRLALPPIGMRDGGATPDLRGGFYCLASDQCHVYALYSGNKFKGDALPMYECKHLIVYGWDGRPRRHYVLDKNINNFTLHGGRIVGISSYPSNRIIYYDLPEDLRHDNDEER